MLVETIREGKQQKGGRERGGDKGWEGKKDERNC